MGTESNNLSSFGQKVTSESREHNRNIRIIKRYSEPNSYDHAPHGSYCYVYRDEFSCDVYIQSSSKEDEPDWHYMGVKLIEDIIDE